MSDDAAVQILPYSLIVGQAQVKLAHSPNTTTILKYIR